MGQSVFVSGTRAPHPSALRLDMPHTSHVIERVGRVFPQYLESDSQPSCTARGDERVALCSMCCSSCLRNELYLRLPLAGQTVIRKHAIC